MARDLMQRQVVGVGDVGIPDALFVLAVVALLLTVLIVRYRSDASGEADARSLNPHFLIAVMVGVSLVGILFVGLAVWNSLE